MISTEPRTVVLLFKPRFVEPVRSGRKRQTVRRGRKSPVRPGDVLSLRHWVGKPYRSPQDLIVPDAVCTSVSPVRVAVDVWENIAEIEVGGERLTRDEVCAFVRADGFSCVSDFCDYYQAGGHDTFEGVLIRWED